MKVKHKRTLGFSALIVFIMLNLIAYIHAYKLKGEKVLKVYKHEGHDVFTPRNQLAWVSDVASFINTIIQ